jgi:hypothetical protein
MTSPITNGTLRTLSLAEVRAARASTTMAGMPARGHCGSGLVQPGGLAQPGATTPSMTGTAARLRATAAR